MKVLKLALFCGCAATGMAFAANARAMPQSSQQTVPPPTSGQSSTGEGPAASEGAPQPQPDIVVTGSRIVRDGFNAPTPTTVVGEDLLQAAAPASLADALEYMPAFRAVSSTGTANQTVAGTGGQSFANLRGLGATRTLTLVDRERVVPTTATGTLDISLIPASVLERLDVVTGGASAAYGSDAVAGVVNFVTAQSLKGLRGQIEGGISERSDNKSVKLSAAFGTDFAGGRGRILLGAEYSDFDGVPARSRPWSGGGSALNDIGNPAYTPTNGQPQFFRRSNFYFGNQTFGGVILGGPLAGTQFLPGGGTAPFTFCSLNNASGQLCDSPRDLPHFNYFTLMSTPQERFAGVAKLSFEVAPDVTLRLTGLHGRSDTAVNTIWPTTLLLGNITVDSTNPYIPAAFRPQLAVSGVTTFQLGRSFRDFPEAIIDRQNRFTNVSGGVNAQLGGGWTLDAYGSYGVSHQRFRILNNTISARFREAVNVVAGPGGAPVCASALTTPGTACRPLDIFGDGSASTDAIAYITGTSDADLRFEQIAAGATLSGDLLSTWAGPVSVAIGSEYRRQDARQTVDALSATSQFMLANPKAFGGAVSVKEVFGEIVVPLAKDAAWARSLDLNAAVRYTDYSTSGAVTTWKAGLTWQIVPGLMLRGTRSRDIRAPNILELFTNQIQGTQQVVDPRTGLVDAFQGLTGGNPALKAEKSDTTALGVVLRPGFLPGLGASIDYYRIDVQGAIATLSALNVLTGCEAGRTDLCALVVRAPSGDIQTISLNFQNFQNLRTSGLDLEFSYETRIGAGNLLLRALGNYTHDYQVNDGIRTLDLAGGLADSLPKWVWTFSTQYRNDFGRLMLKADRIGGGTYSNRALYENNRVEPIWYFDATAEVNVPVAGAKAVTAYLNVANVLDQAPPFGFGFQNGNYDRIGRTYKLGLRFSF